MTLDRRRFLTLSSFALAGSLKGSLVLAQSPQSTPAAAPPATPTPRFVPLREDVGYLIGQGGAIGWLINRDAVVVVDTQTTETAGACLAGVKERANNRVIDVLFNTHHHDDHTGGNPVFRPAAKTIVAHENVPALQKKAARPGMEASQVYADTTYSSVWSESFGRERVTARNYGPAHTAGDSVITLQRANVVHMGDLVFNRRVPGFDRPGGCAIAAWASMLERVAKEHDADTIYIFGHAKAGLPPTGSRAELLLQRDFLTELLERARAGVQAGKARDEVVKMTTELKGLEDFGPVTAGALGAAWDEISGAETPPAK
jgi:cyclase